MSTGSSRPVLGARLGLPLLAALGLLIGLSGCARWNYKPPIPTDYVGWRYSQHNYMRKFFSKSSSRSGNYVVTTTISSVRGGGRRVLRVPDRCPPVSRANAHILRVNPRILNMPFVSVDGVRIDQPGQATPIGTRALRRRRPTGLQ